MVAALSFGSGALLGFASSLHCIGMCGGIVLALGVPAAVEGRLARCANILSLHLGRLMTYASFGALAGAVGGSALDFVTVEGGHLLMRWAAAMTLIWIGLASMGLLPSPALLGHRFLPRLALPGRQLTLSLGGRFMAGVGWGLLPCSMVYGALLFAAFAGSALGGLTVMAGFASGTLPALIAVQAGGVMLSNPVRRAGARWISGLAICVVAIASLLPAETVWRAMCRSVGLSV